MDHPHTEPNAFSECAIELPADTPAIMPIRDDFHLVSAEDYLMAPLRDRGAVEIHEVNDFIRTVDSLTSDIPPNGVPMAFADLDHSDGNRALGHLQVVSDFGTPSSPAWGEKTITLPLSIPDTSMSWLNAAHGWMSQKAFADLIDNRNNDVMDPEPLEVVAAIEKITTSKNSRVTSAIHVGSHQTKVSWTMEQEAGAGERGDVKIPSDITIGIPLIKQATGEDIGDFNSASHLHARIATSIDTDGKLVFRLVFPDLDETFDKVFRNLVAHVAEKTGLHFLRGRVAKTPRQIGR